jgi:hypothetical protein
MMSGRFTLFGDLTTIYSEITEALERCTHGRVGESSVPG